jgi:phage baseplate assembly protein W
MPIKKLTIKPNNQTVSLPTTPTYIYKGFSSKNENQNYKIYDNDCIRQDILNQFNTRKGERVMNPEFGTIIWDAIFEPMTQTIKDEIAEDIRNILGREPRVITEDVKIDEFQTGILLEITLRYRTNDLRSVIKLNFDREIGLISS